MDVIGLLEHLKQGAFLSYSPKVESSAIASFKHPQIDHLRFSRLGTL